MANRAAAFFESFNEPGVWRGGTCESSNSVKGRFRCHGHTSQYPSSLSRVSTGRCYRSFLCRSNSLTLVYAQHNHALSAGTWRGARAQSGCPSKAASEPGRSAKVPCALALFGRPSFGGQRAGVNTGCASIAGIPQPSFHSRCLAFK